MKDLKSRLDKESINYISELKKNYKNKLILDNKVSISRRRIHNFLLNYENLINHQCKNIYTKYSETLRDTHLNILSNEFYTNLNECTSGSTLLIEKLHNTSNILDKFISYQEKNCLEKCIPLINNEKVYNNCLNRCVKFSFYGEISKYHILSSILQ